MRLIIKIKNFLKNGDIKYFIYFKYSLILGYINTKINILIYGGRLTLGKNSNIWGSIRFLIDGNGSINIGNDFHAVSSRRRSYSTLFSPCHLTSVRGGKIILGNHVGLNGNTIVCKKQIKIEDETMIGANTIITDHDGHSISPIDRWVQNDNPKEISIGKNCWIGMNCIILKGVSIGNNTVIAAGSIVVKDCKENSVYGGNPAKKIKNIV